MGGNKVQAPTPPPAPAPVDYTAESVKYLNAMTDPALQQRLLDAEREFRPQYADLEIADINRYGSALNALQEQATRSQTQIGIEAQSAQRAADIRDVEQYGQRATQAFMQANPLLMQQMEANRSLQGQGADLTALQRMIGQGVPGGQISTQAIDQGPLGQLLQQQAMGATVGGTGQALNQRAQQLAGSTGGLSATELRNLQQSVRGAYAARGTEMGSAAVSAEALSRLTNERQRMQEDIALAAQLNQGFLAEQNANRAFQQGVYGTDLARQQQNEALRLGTAESNRAFGAQQYQQGIGNLGALAQLQQGQLESNRGYGLQLAAQQAAVASDPFQAILGRPSAAPGMGMASSQFAAGLAGQPAGPNLFSPDAGINLALQQQANQANYLSAIYGSQAGAAGAQAQAQGAQRAGMITGAGSAALGIGLAVF